MWYLLSGILMGIANVVPGVSGGTIAVLMGIYDKLIEAVDSLVSRDFKSLRILLPVGFGILGGIFGFASFLEYSLSNYPVPTRFFFVGLVVVSFIKAKGFFRFNRKNLILVLIGIVCVLLLNLMNKGESKENLLFLLLGGFVAAIAMVIPGISGSLILLILGVYDSVLSMVSHLIVGKLLIFSLGAALGLIVSIKVMKFFLKNFKEETYSFIGGMIVASLYEVLPKNMVSGDIPFSILSFILSLILGIGLLKVEKKLSAT
ncbi:DUF368 domain-containing protein [Thermotoga sp. KOL6]|uniref:DUF368 domain-containing protein n=1 Tax=Thermotoga sp. KOL6 TaxID=126741 RepID=UPI000CC186C6|nr:DUF368 domain-containing protein [Thermotoga sp. KOL6]PLV58753.1 hypothetical protein AS005_07685 [Thermotoga sp. KOL6]